MSSGPENKKVSAVADVSKTIQIIFGATDNTGNALTSIGDGLGAIEQNVGKVTGPLADIADSILKTETALAALGAAFVGFSINEAGKFNDSVNEIYTLVSASPEQFGKFKDSILEYATTSTQSLESINGAVYSAISAGTDYSHSLDLVNKAEQLAVAGRGDLNATTVLLASTLNAYGASADEASRYSDALFQTVKLGQTTLPELAKSLAQVTGVASSAGIPFETLTAAVAQLTAAGLPTSQAITGIKAAISNILKPTKDASDLAAELGISFDATTLKTKGFEGLLKDLYTATGGNTEQMSKFFGSIEGLNAALVLSQNGATGFIDKITQMADAAGSTAEAYGKMSDNFANVNQKIANNIDAVLIATGNKLLSSYGDVGAGIVKVFQALGTSINAGTFDPLFKVLNDASGALGDFLDTLAKNLPAALAALNFDAIVNGFDAIGQAAQGLFDGVDLNTPEGLATALQKIVNVGGGFLQVTAGIIEGLTPLINTIASAASGFGDLDSNTQQTAGNVLGWGKAIDTVLPAIGGLGDGIGALGTGLEALAGAKALATISTLTIDFEKLGFAIGQVIKVAAGTATFVAFYELGDYLGKTFIGNKLDESILSASDSLLGFFGVTTEHSAAANDALEQQAFAIDKLKQITGDASITAENYAEKLAAYSSAVQASISPSEVFAKTTGDVKASIDALDLDAVAKGYYQWQTAADGTRKMVKLTDDELKEINRTIDEFYGAKPSKGFDDLTASLVSTTKEGTDTVKMFQDASGNIKYVWEASTKAADGLNTFDSAAVKTAKSAEDLANKTALTKKEAASLYVELQKLATDKEIALIESNVKLNVAEIEAQTQQVKAAFDSINTTVNSTGDLIGSLFGDLAGASRWTQLLIEDQIKIENDRRQKALEDQHALTEAQIENLKAKTEALQKGDAIIKISGDGLEPEIEAFMWEILKRIQVRANADAQEFLLGITA